MPSHWYLWEILILIIEHKKQMSILLCDTFNYLDASKSYRSYIQDYIDQ